MIATRVLEWVERQTGSTVVGARPLVGGLTADVDRLTLHRPPGDPGDPCGPGTRWQAVLRRWTNAEWWTEGLVEHESAVLGAVAGHGLPAPEVIAADPTGAQAGVRCLLMTALPGAPDLRPADRADWLRQLASTQARIHALAPPQLDVEGRFDEPTDPDWLAGAVQQPPAVRSAVRSAARDADPHHDVVFAHGDYQHFNVLWTDGRLSGVVDWPLAGAGPRALDVGHCLLNLAVLFDADAADTYAHRYEAAAGVRLDARGVLRALSRAGPSWPQFIPRQVAGRAVVDSAGMLERVAQLMTRWLARLDR